MATKLAEERRRLVRAVELAGDGEVDDWDEPEMARVLRKSMDDGEKQTSEYLMRRGQERGDVLDGETRGRAERVGCSGP